MASLSEIQAQRDVVNGAIDAWGVAAEQSSSDATTAASAGAVAETAQQAADASEALAQEKRATAQAEAQKLADMFAETPATRRGKKT